MPKILSAKTKKIRHMGEGVDKDYSPYITTSEFNSLGTTSVITDWKTGRGVHCLSQSEAYWYYILRWDDENIDIREQYPLDENLTKELAKSIDIKHPNTIMTTDFLVTKSDGTYHAYSIKATRDGLNQRTLEKLYLEKTYWEVKNISFDLLFKEDVNVTLVNNIRQVIAYYKAESVFDKVSYIKNKIATKELSVDLNKNIDFNELSKQVIYKEK